MDDIISPANSNKLFVLDNKNRSDSALDKETETASEDKNESSEKDKDKFED